MGYRLALLALVIAPLASSACGKEIGDACQLSTDCSPNADRICDVNQPSGYCTIQGCEASSCPDDAVCVRFFNGGFSTACDPGNSADGACSLDEVCTISGAAADPADPTKITGHCVPRSSEIRYCMKACDSNDDCRDGYECRDVQKMRDHGGEPVVDDGKALDASAPKFCAAAPQ